MIAYFDTSAVVPLIIDEPSSEFAERFWDQATRVVSSRLLYPEARAAIARARRMNRITTTTSRLAVSALDELLAQVDIIELDLVLSRRAGELAELHDLRGYDAVHLASAERVADREVVVVAGDVDLGRAARVLGLATASTAPGSRHPPA